MRVPAKLAAKLAKPPISEREFMKNVMDLAALRGWRCFHQRPGMTKSGKWRSAIQGKGSDGFPDLVLVRRERLLFIELKADRGIVSDAQHEWIEALNKIDGAVFAYILRPSQWDMIEEILL